MPPLETPSPKSPLAQASLAPASADEPRSRKPTRASKSATPATSKSAIPVTSHGGSELPAQIHIYWNEDAEQMLKSHAREQARERESKMNRIGGRGIYNASQGAKRAHNLIARGAMKLALQRARSLYPSLDSHLETMEVPVQWNIDLQWIDDAEMQVLNRDTRGKDKPTDVLSFPVWEGEAFPAPPDQSAVMLGDMVISVETAIRQARELKHDLRAEIAFLAAHGTLHLLGYDHGTDSERRQMFALQDEIVAQLREAKGF